MIAAIEPSKEMVNVGVTAKLVSPLRCPSAVVQSSSTDTDNTMLHTKYQKFLDQNHLFTPSDSNVPPTTSDDSKTLYQLKAIKGRGLQKLTPSKIEFSLYRKSQRKFRKKLVSGKTVRPKKSHSSMKRLLESESKSDEIKLPPQIDMSLMSKLKKSFRKMKNHDNAAICQKPAKDSKIDIYPFDHGCAEYLRTTDFAPQLISDLLAQRAADIATKFWAEFFGSLHIGVAFILSFFLQAYRFVLHSVVKSIIVDILQMTSDYGVKPLLAVLFNGFLQPPLIFAHNILSSVRDVLEPVSEALSQFLKPLGALLRSVRLATVNIRNRERLVKDV